MEVQVKNDSVIGVKVVLSKEIAVGVLSKQIGIGIIKNYTVNPILSIFACLFFVCWVIALLNFLGFNI